MYPVTLALHNILRWVALLTAVYALWRAYSGWLGRRTFTPADRRAGVFFGSAMDLQLLLGLLLYIFFSPLTRRAFQDFGAAMQAPDLRFFAIEHIFYMLLAVVAAHLGSVFARRAQSDAAKHRTAALLYTLAVLLVLIAIPWSRPLLPGLG